MTNPDEYLTVHNGKAPKPPSGPYNPNPREMFWLCVGCAHVAGVGFGLGFMAMVWRSCGG